MRNPRLATGSNDAQSEFRVIVARDAMSGLGLILVVALSQTPAEQRLLEAQAMLSQLEDKKAAETAEAGLKLTPPDPIAAKLLITLGLARFNLLDAEGARRAFRAAAIADPQLLPPDDANPRAVTLFGEARAQARAEETPPPYRYVGIALAGVGVLALGAAVGFGFSSQLARSHAVSNPSAESAQGEMTVAQNRATAANWMYAVGGVFAAGGGAVAIWSFVGGAGLSYRTSF
jgi:hypothetical protein